MRWISADLPEMLDFGEICRQSRDFTVDPQITDHIALVFFNGPKSAFGGSCGGKFGKLCVF